MIRKWTFVIYKKSWLLFSLPFIYLNPIYSQNLTVVLANIKELKGVLVLCLSEEGNFLTDCVDQKFISVTDTGTVKVVFQSIQKGTYAVSVFHDLNENSTLDVKGIFKIPIEPFGFSSNPHLFFGPPKFHQCAFVVDENDFELYIKLKSF